MKIKDRYAYLNPEREKGLHGALIQDFSPLDSIGTRISGSKASHEFNRRISIFLTHIYNNARDLFISDWVKIELSEKKAQYEVTDILYDWCSLRKGFTLSSLQTFEEAFIDDRSGRNRLYPLGQYILLRSSPTPTWVKLSGWNPTFEIQINCAEVQSISGEIDKMLVIKLPSININLSNKISLTPR